MISESDLQAGGRPRQVTQDRFHMEALLWKVWGAWTSEASVFTPYQHPTQAGDYSAIVSHHRVLHTRHSPRSGVMLALFRDPTGHIEQSSRNSGPSTRCLPRWKGCLGCVRGCMLYVGYKERVHLSRLQLAAAQRFCFFCTFASLQINRRKTLTVAIENIFCPAITTVGWDPQNYSRIARETPWTGRIKEQHRHSKPCPEPV